MTNEIRHAQVLETRAINGRIFFCTECGIRRQRTRCYFARLMVHANANEMVLRKGWTHKNNARPIQELESIRSTRPDQAIDAPWCLHLLTDVVFSGHGLKIRENNKSRNTNWPFKRQRRARFQPTSGPSMGRQSSLARWRSGYDRALASNYHGPLRRILGSYRMGVERDYARHGWQTHCPIFGSGNEIKNRAAH